jgi:hypothetical protein
MGNRRDAIAVAVVLASMIALALLLRTREREASSSDPRASTFLATPLGARALLLLAEELDLETRRRLEPYTVAPEEDVRLAVVLAPTEGFTPREAARLLDWVRDGGALFYALGGAPLLADSLGLSRRLQTDGSGARRRRPRPSTAMATDTPLVADIGVLDTFRFVFSDSTKPIRSGNALVLASAQRGPAVIAFSLGAGRVIAFSDVSPLTNESLRNGGVALLFARIAGAEVRDTGVIEFDEYHQGYRAGGGPWAALRSFLGTRPGYGVLQLALAGLLVLLLAARRFGEPHLPAPPRRRSPIEHVEALATAYQRAGARRTARKLLLEGLQRRLGRRPRLPAAGETGVPSGLERSAAGQRFIEEWERGEDARLVTLSQAVDDVVAEVRRW